MRHIHMGGADGGGGGRGLRVYASHKMKYWWGERVLGFLGAIDCARDLLRA
jgi:hypothetical protein